MKWTRIILLQEFYLPMQSGGILSPEHLAAIFLNLQVDTERDTSRYKSDDYARSLCVYIYNHV